MKRAEIVYVTYFPRDENYPETLEKARKKYSYYQVNYEGTKNLLNVLTKNSKETLKKFVYCSSLAAAGPALNSRPVNEDTGCNPVSNYGRSKRLGEDAVLNYSKVIPVLIIRPPAVYGPNDKDIFNYFKLHFF